VRTVHWTDPAGDQRIYVVTAPGGVPCEQGCVNLWGRTFHPANRPHDHGLDGRRHADDPPAP
jgi:hypothetical protein